MTDTPPDHLAQRPGNAVPLRALEAAWLNDEVLEQPVRNPFTGFGLVVAIILILAFVLRILRLDTYLLGELEGRWAMNSWGIYTGAPLPGSVDLPDTSPFFQLVNAISFFLFGVTDATARLAPAMIGFGIVVLVFSLRPFVSRSHLAAMATLAAISPTLVFASRTIDPAISAAFFAFLTLITILRAGVAGSGMTQAGWSLGAGLGLAGMLGSGVDGVTALLALGIGVFAAAVTDPSGRHGTPRGVVRSGVMAIGSSTTNIALLFAGFALACVILFTRMFTGVTALAGVITTFTDWGRMMMSRATSLPSSFYFWALLLYELLALFFGLLAIISRRSFTVDHPARRQELNPVLFGAWFFAALVLHSLASGRETEQTVLIVLPLVLLGGIGFGDVLARIDASGFWERQSWGMVTLVLGIALALVASAGLILRMTDEAVHSADPFPTWLIILFVAVMALITFGAVGALPSRRGQASPVRIVDPVLVLVATALALFGMVATTALAFQRGDEGVELLARHIPAEEADVFISRVHQVSRDLSVEQRSNIDPTGRYSIRVGVHPDVQWPFAWYFRDYPTLRVTPPGGWDDETDVAIAPTADGMETYDLTPQQQTWMIRQPRPHVDLDAGAIFGRFAEPGSWSQGIRYLLGRDIENPQEPATITVGYSNRVSNQLNPNFGPFDLFSPDNPGPGSGQGQLNQPAGIDVSPDGDVIYVLNAGNQRIDRYERDGTFIGVWDGAVDQSLGLSWNVNQGGTGLTVSKDGLIYIADTWNHVVVVVDENGTVVRQLGQRGILTDITDAGDPSEQQGLFFGPRGVAVTNERIFVTDTGNERVQVFSMDGTFLNAFGGFGSDEGRFMEPTGIVIGPDGNVWVADSGNARIQIFTIEGEFVEAIPVPEWQNQLGIDRINALDVGPDGIVYLTSPMAGVVQAYDGEEFVTIPNLPQVRAGGLAMTPDGRLLVTDVNGAVVHDIVPELPEGFGEEPEAPGPSPQASPAATPLASPKASPAATPERD